MSNWKKIQGSGKQAAAAVLCAALVLGTPFTALAAENTTEETEADTGRAAAVSMIAEASDTENGDEVVSAAQDTLTDQQTEEAITAFIDTLEEVLISKEAAAETQEALTQDEHPAETGTAGSYHFSGAGRSSVQIKRELELLKAYLTEQGERVEDAEGQFFVLKGKTESGEDWSITYLPADMQLRFVYKIEGEGSTAMLRMSYDMETLETGNVGIAVWGVSEAAGQFAAAWEAPFHRMLSTRTRELVYTELYSNFAKGHEKQYQPALTVLTSTAFDCWQEELTKVQEVGLGEIGFGAYDTYGWVRNADAKWMYMYKDGTYAGAGWKEIGGKWFHFDKGGCMETGWIEENGRRYYCGENGAMVTGTVTIGTQEFTFDENGVLQE